MQIHRRHSRAHRVGRVALVHPSVISRQVRNRVPRPLKNALPRRQVLSLSFPVHFRLRVGGRVADQSGRVVLLDHLRGVGVHAGFFAHEERMGHGEGRVAIAELEGAPIFAVVLAGNVMNYE